MFKKFVSYYKPHKKMFVLDMFASFLISAIGLIYPIITRRMMNEWGINGQVKEIVIAGSILLGLYIIRWGLRYFVQYYGHVIGVKMQAQMRHDMFEKLQRLPFKYYDNNETGKIMSRLTNDLMDVSELAHHGPENFFISGVMIIGSFIYLCTINVLLTLIVFTCVPILLLIALPLRRKLDDAFMQSRKSVAGINASVESSVSGIRLTKAYTNDKKEKEKFKTRNKDYVEARRKAYKAMGEFHSTTSFVTELFNVIILVAGGIFISQAKLSAPDYTAFVVSIGLFISPVTTLIGFIEQLQDGITGFRRFMEVMDQEEEKDAEDAIDLKVDKGVIDFENVTFSYNGEKNVLENINLHIDSGCKLALVGPSGGGKTTICHLLPRFYTTNEGKISIDGIDISKVTLKSLRQNIGIVQQDVFLFTGTILENILYGRLDATMDEVIDAAKKANIHDYIMSLKDGYDSEIGERGVKLSGGQKQRLSIARIFLKNPSILILDEATSSLDNTTEILIQTALDELCKGRTTIVVAHRLSTIRNANEIVVMAKGKIKEEGSHEELMKVEGIYSSLYNLQFRESDNLALMKELEIYSS